MLEIDFSTVFHLEIEDELPRRSWRWFETKVAGLLANNGLLAHHFRPTDKPAEEAE